LADYKNKTLVSCVYKNINESWLYCTVQWGRSALSYIVYIVFFALYFL